jgi:membrane associated rhomboid family serine protease
MMRITEAVKQLIIINILFYVGSLIIGDAAYDLLALHFPANPDFKPWQFITYMFMHSKSDFGHIIFNMLGLWMFGSMLEQMWGAKKFIFFYLSCGIGAAALHIAINYYTYSSGLELLVDNGINTQEILALLNKDMYNQNWDSILGIGKATEFAGSYISPMVGASGAIYGLLVAFAFMFPNIEMMMIFVPIPIKAKYFVPGILAFDMFMGIKGQAVLGQGDGVAHFAHLGGALIGFLMMWYWKKNQYNNRRWN